MGVTSFLKQPQEIAFVDSPQYVKIKDTGNVVAASIIQVELKIWSGPIGTPPALPQYTLNLPAVPTTGIETETSFEISKFVKEFISNDYYVSTAATQYNGDSAVWFTINIEADNGNTPEISLAKLGLSGFGYYEDSTNPGTTISAENGKVFCEQSSKLIYTDGRQYLIPVYIGSTSTNAEYYSNTGDFAIVADFGFTLNSTDSSEQIAYLSLNDTTVGTNLVIGTDTVYHIADAGDTTSKGDYTAVVDCVKGEVMSLKYLNSCGSISEFPVNGKDSLTIQAKRLSYKNNPLDSDLEYDTTNHIDKIFNINGSRIINVTTGWIYEETNNMIKDLMFSKSIWLEYGSVTYPVQIRDTAKKVLNRTWDSQVGYDFTLEVSTPIINQVL